MDKPAGAKKVVEMPMLEGFQHLAGYIDAAGQRALWSDIAAVLAVAPFYRPTMPNSGKPFSVSMTNCGQLGWVSDKLGGYRYQAAHPLTGRDWPPLPARLIELWQQVAHYPALPEACLINHYEAGTKLGSHVDADEADTAAPVVSVSLGDDAVFHVGGLRRSDPRTRMVLRSGDVVILGGTARKAYHGIDRIMPGTSALVPLGGRVNLTMRRVTLPDSRYG